MVLEGGKRGKRKREGGEGHRKGREGGREERKRMGRRKSGSRKGREESRRTETDLILSHSHWFPLRSQIITSQRKAEIKLTT